MDNSEKAKAELRAKIEEEIEKSSVQPVPAPTKTDALKIFKRSDAYFGTPKFDELLLQAVPLISAGFVRKKAERLPHQEMLKKAKVLMDKADEKTLANGFIYGIVHKDCREYILPFVAYHFFKNFPNHEKTRWYLGEENEENFLPNYCGVCDYCDDTPPKRNLRSTRYHQFLDAFIDAEFLYRAKTYASYPVNHALYCLEEGTKFPKVQLTEEDFSVFIAAVRLAESIPSNKKVGAYKQVLHKSKLLPLTGDEAQEFINVLSYLNILHPKDMFGYAEKYTPLREQKEADEHKNDYAYPVCHWCGADGVDYKMIEKLFGKLDCFQL